MKQASGILIIENNKVLAVSRKEDPTDFGLPCGKVEDGESFSQAAIRELGQETGLIASNLSLVFWDYVNEYLVKTFVTGNYSGIIQTKEKGIVEFVDFDVIFNGSFGNYNKKLFKRLGLI